MPAPVQPNTSATGGFLLPANRPAPLEDKALEDFFQALVAGITGLASTVVFPRWQTEPPNLPAYGTNWVAVGIVDSDPDRYAAVVHNSDGQGSDQLQRHEQIDLMASFYGPNARSNASLFSDGLQIPQNREVLTQNTMGLTFTGKLQQLPALIKMQWTTRVDLPFRIKRGIKRVYPVLNLRKFQTVINTDVGGAVPVVEIAIASQPNSNQGGTS